MIWGIGNSLLSSPILFAIASQSADFDLTNLYMMDSANGFSNSRLHQPLFSFGVITDVQYADIPDGHSFRGIPRFYRHSIKVLQRAVSSWNGLERLKFSINFGDIVDGFCPKDQSLTAVWKVLEEFDKFNAPVYHMIGNHCLYNLPRCKLTPLLNMPDCGYYEFSPVPEYRFVVLDAYDISVLGWPEDHPKALAAMEILRAKNPNADKNSPVGLAGLEKRFVLFNGAVGEEQLDWLDRVLCDSHERKQKVVVCCHLPLDPGAAIAESLLWNYEEVMEVVHRYDCVKVCFAGHDHRGGYSVDSRGMHHRVLEAALECPPGTDAYGHVDVYDDRMCLWGTDRMARTEIVFL